MVERTMKITDVLLMLPFSSFYTTWKSKANIRTKTKLYV